MDSISSLVIMVVLGVARICEGTSLVPLRRAPSPCGDWTLFKDEKCIKIATRAGHQTQQDAEVVCEAFSEELHRESYPKLITIKTKEEQEFLEKFLFVENHIEDYIWLGLKEVGNTGEFQWNDGSMPIFTNWANQTISDDQHHCVHMESGGGIQPAGMWVKVTCNKATTVVCERTQTLTLEALQNMFYNYKLEQKYAIDSLMQKNEELKELINLQETPVPVGFIYTQLPNQDAPITLWPGTKWIDVSAKYAGLFFRVEGGNSAPFGQIQEGNSSRLEEVGLSARLPSSNSLTIPPDGTWSQYIYTGGTDVANSVLRFRLSTEEVRPRNQAIRLWQKN